MIRMLLSEFSILIILVALQGVPLGCSPADFPAVSGGENQLPGTCLPDRWLPWPPGGGRRRVQHSPQEPAVGLQPLNCCTTGGGDKTSVGGAPFFIFWRDTMQKYIG